MTNPTSNSTWTKDTFNSITWNHTGIFSDVKIELYESESLERTIASSTSNTGSYDWRVDTSLPAGTTYRIKITSTSNAEVYDYSDYFAIEDEERTSGFLVVSVILALAVVMGMRVRRKRK
ncbi:MAG: GPI anchored serine-threonine rich family protein [Promethearchaeota archaeon]